jgi:hypothetical protein
MHSSARAFEIQRRNIIQQTTIPVNVVVNAAACMYMWMVRESRGEETDVRVARRVGNEKAVAAITAHEA